MMSWLPAEAAFRTLRATRRRMRMFSPSYTAPIPPVPIRRVRRYLPSMTWPASRSMLRALSTTLTGIRSLLRFAPVKNGEQVPHGGLVSVRRGGRATNVAHSPSRAILASVCGSAFVDPLRAHLARARKSTRVNIALRGSWGESSWLDVCLGLALDIQCGRSDRRAAVLGPRRGERGHQSLRRGSLRGG